MFVGTPKALFCEEGGWAHSSLMSLDIPGNDSGATCGYFCVPVGIGREKLRRVIVGVGITVQVALVVKDGIGNAGAARTEDDS